MKLNKDSRKLSRQLYRSSFSDGKLDDSRVGAVVESILASRPRHYLDILKDYHRLIRLEVDKRHAIVESAAALNEETSREVERDLKSKYGGDLTTDFRVNPDLIGGLRIKIGNNVWDGSVRNRLARLSEEINHV